MFSEHTTKPFGLVLWFFFCLIYKSKVYHISSFQIRTPCCLLFMPSKRKKDYQYKC